MANSFDQRPTIDVGIPYFRDAVSKIQDLLSDDEVLFRFGDVPVRLEHDMYERPILVPLTPERFRHELAWRVKFICTTRDGTRIVDPPSILVNAMLDGGLQLKDLRRIVSVPVFTSEGKLIREFGYYGGLDKIYYDALSGPWFEASSIPKNPSADDVLNARMLLLDDLFADFPFVSEADRANAVALFLLPFVRDLIDGPTPLHMIQAPVEGSGKGLLATVALLPGIGYYIEAILPGRNEDGWRKLITDKIRSGSPVVWIDHISRPLFSNFLASVITSDNLEDSFLSEIRNKTIRLPVTCIWVATANNPTLSGEIARRTVHIRLDTKMDAPWRRRKFKHDHLVRWLNEHEKELIWSALVLVQNWLANGRPAPNVAPLGSFEVWTQVIGGILECAGISGFLDNVEECFERSVPNITRWRAFVEAWWEQYRENSITTRDLVPLAINAELDVRGEDDAARARSLGKQLERMRDRVFGGYRIEQTWRDSMHFARWRLRVVVGEALLERSVREGRVN